MEDIETINYKKYLYLMKKYKYLFILVIVTICTVVYALHIQDVNKQTEERENSYYYTGTLSLQVAYLQYDYVSKEKFFKERNYVDKYLLEYLFEKSRHLVTLEEPKILVRRFNKFFKTENLNNVQLSFLSNSVTIGSRDYSVVEFKYNNKNKSEIIKVFETIKNFYQHNYIPQDYEVLTECKTCLILVPKVVSEEIIIKNDYVISTKSLKMKMAVTLVMSILLSFGLAFLFERFKITK